MKLAFTLLCILFLPCLLLAQVYQCGFDHAHQQGLKTIPAYQKAVEQQNKLAKAYIQKIANERRTGKVMATVQIPIVVHVVHTGGAAGSFYNPSDALVQSTVDYVNQLYAGTHSSNDPGGVGEVGIEFVLARRDPQCNPTTGINHLNGSGLPGYTAHGVNLNSNAGISDTVLRNFIRWDPSVYYNIYVVNKIDDFDAGPGSGTGVAGFAYFPGLAELDGTIILAGACAPGNYILPHELGHAFNLYHPFEGGSVNSCPIEMDPLMDGDQVPDTDPVTQPVNFECRPNATHPLNYCVNPPAGVPYSINTERNIMNYSGCNTYLFTAGQKARMEAALLLPIRQSLINSAGDLPTNDNNLPCIPKINFAMPAANTLAESTAATVDCRGYQDHTFAITIGGSPTADATVALQITSGTANATQDIDLLTPVVIFPAGVDTAQYYTIRVYDDAAVEGEENFVLSFTVNNGGGNAAAGDALNTLSFQLTDNDEAPHITMPVTYTVGSSTGIIVSPWQGNLAAAKSQMLYKASELQAAGMVAGNITGFVFSLVKNTPAGYSYQNTTIKMANTTRLHLFATGGTIPLNDAAHTIVYTGNFVPADGENSIHFATPFNWDGVSNIVITVCYNNGATVTSGDENMASYADGAYAANQADYVVQQSISSCTDPITSFSIYGNGRKPLWRFIGTDQQTPVQTQLNAKATASMGPYAELYFYDNAQQHLLARIKNLSAHDYGCTTVEIDRAGAGATPFNSNTPARFLMDKTFRVMPDHNDAAGAYELTLYYTQQEVQGWEAATGQSFNNIQLIKVPGQIKDVTPLAPNAAGPPETLIPLRGTLGTHYTLTASFQTGFSGFGAGILAAALPVTLIDFTGLVKENHVYLQWNTAAEVNLRGFYVERSYDGVQFTAIAFVPAAGAGTGRQSYTFRDQEAAQIANYYRLRLVDVDNHFGYSKIIIANNPFNSTVGTIINNPVHSSLEIQWNRSMSGVAEMRLSDVSGRVLQYWRGPANKQMQIALSPAVTPGVYLVQLWSGDRKIVKKIIVQ
jgi:hypothetical protein